MFMTLPLAGPASGGADIITARELEVCCTDDDLDDNRLPSALERV